MKIGYVGDSSIEDYHSARRFRLASFTPEKFLETARLNLEGLHQNIQYAVSKGIFCYRIRSEIIPFASHEVCHINWREKLSKEFSVIAKTIRETHIRVSTHPDQFVVLNSPNAKVVENSIKELAYHADMFEMLELPSFHKFQIHVGGVYGDKKTSMERFITTYKTLSRNITEHLVIENDDKLYTVNDCVQIHKKTGVPVLFDNFHHTLNNEGEPLIEAMKVCFATWQKKDGIPAIDYSSQQEGWRTGRHADSLDKKQFSSFIQQTRPLDFDIMLEIKDKDASALQALEILKRTINL